MPNLQPIPLKSLLSPKERIQFREFPSGESGKSFFDLIDAFRKNLYPPSIQVEPMGNQYIIKDGVRRALAALAAGKTHIQAEI